MGREVLYAVPGLVEVSWDSDLQAVWLTWFTEYHEGSAVRDAVEFALDYVRENGVAHWVGDLSVSKQGLKPEDQAWVSSDFKRAIAATPLKKLVLVPPGPETGQDVAWLDEWEAKTRAELGDRMDARLLSDAADIRAFFLG